MDEAPKIDDEQNNLVVRDQNGDPLPDPKAVVMREKDSYERIRDGLHMAADGAKHCARQELVRFQMWMALAEKLDLLRKAACEMAGLSDRVERQSGEVIGEGMGWLEGRKRFTEGLKQASGGCRQIGVVHRGDIAWLDMARKIDVLSQSVSRKPYLYPEPMPSMVKH